MSEPRRITLSSAIPRKPGGVQKRLEALRRHAPLRGRRLLEIGCANGDYALALAPSFAQVVGIDLQLGELPIALERGLPVAQMSAERLAFPTASFDAVIAIEVLEHVGSLRGVFDEVHRVLAPEGLFMFTSPNRYFPFETHSVHVAGRRFSGKYLPLLPYVRPLHSAVAEARNFTAKELRTSLDAAGFDEVGADYVMPPFDGWRFGRRFVKPITDAMEASRLKVLGVSVVGVYRRRSLGSRAG
jgi:SAM-dependent methyltransferase